MKQGPKAYIFDMDGTLFDSSSAVPEAYIASIKHLGGPAYDRDQIIAAYAIGPPSKILAHLLGRSSTSADLDAYHRYLEVSSRGLIPYDGILRTLEELRKRQALAVFSGASRRACELLLRAGGLEPLFSIVVGGDEAERPKPAPDGLLLACKRLGVPPAEAAYVGDSQLDMQTAKAAGCHAIAAAWGHLYVSGLSAPDRVVASPSDLLDSTS